MGCGCGGSGGGGLDSAPGALLSGSLDGQYAGLPGGTSGPSVAAADITGADTNSFVGSFSSGGLWIVLFFVLGAAWYLKREKE